MCFGLGFRLTLYLGLYLYLGLRLGLVNCLFIRRNGVLGLRLDNISWNISWSWDCGVGSEAPVEVERDWLEV